MGKYLRKTRVAGDVVAVMELPQTRGAALPPSGVRTRSRTSSKPTGYSTTSSSSPPSSMCYLQLRNRRLQRLPFCSAIAKEKPSKIFRTLDISSNESIDVQGEINNEVSVDEESFVGSCVAFDKPRDGNSTSDEHAVCSKSADLRRRDDVRAGASLHDEVEEFFSVAEHQQQRLFIDKYNFDIVNDVPLAGRYEWVRVYP